VWTAANAESWMTRPYANAKVHDSELQAWA